MKFPEKLESLLDQRGMTQAQLARATDLAQSAIHDMIKGRRRPYMDQAMLIATALGVSLDYLANDALDTPTDAKLTPTNEDIGLRQVQEVFRAMDYSLSDALRLVSLDTKHYIIDDIKFQPREIKRLKLIENGPGLEVILMNDKRITMDSKKAIAFLTNMLGYRV